MSFPLISFTIAVYSCCWILHHSHHPSSFRGVIIITFIKSLNPCNAFEETQMFICFGILCTRRCLFVLIFFVLLAEREECYNFMIPVMKALLERCEDMLNVSNLLPNIPQLRNNAAFCEEFREYLRSTEWISFMKKQVGWYLFILCFLIQFNQILMFVQHRFYHNVLSWSISRISQLV